MSSNEWKIVKLKDLCKYISRGITPFYDEIDGVVVLNQKCIRNNTVLYDQSRLTNSTKRRIPKEKYLCNNDILVNSTGVGTLGRVAQIKKIFKETTVDSHVTIVRPIDNINPRFLGYNLFLQQANIESLAEGSTGQTELSRVRLGESIKVLIPPIYNQNAIVATLECLEKKIEINNHINKRLEEIIQAIYKSWFIDFEPFKEAEFEYSELGLIPKGWEVKEISEMFDFIGGSQPPKKEHIYDATPGYVRFIQNRDYNNGTHLTYIKESKKNKMCDRYDILMDKYGEAGKIRMGIAGAYNVALAKISPKEPVLREFIRGFFKQASIQEYIKGSTMASTRNSVNAGSFVGIKVALPPISILQQYHEIGDGIIKLILNNIDEIENMTFLRNSILPKLMSGEIIVTIEEDQ